MASNVYSTEPAHPVLAHFLLSQREPAPRIHASKAAQNPKAKDWKLDDEWNAGIKRGNSGIFRCGSVVGFSRFRIKSSDSDEYIGQVKTPTYLFH